MFETFVLRLFSLSCDKPRTDGEKQICKDECHQNSAEVSIPDIKRYSDQRKCCESAESEAHDDIESDLIARPDEQLGGEARPRKEWPPEQTSNDSKNRRCHECLENANDDAVAPSGILES